MTANIDSLNGIWKSEFYGLYGWETVGTLTLRDGKISGGSITHYTTGSYTISGETIALWTSVHFYGEHKPFFGGRKDQMKINMDGKLDGHEISGTEESPENPGQSYRMKLTKQADLP